MTVGLLATSVCLVAWIYLRDRDTNWRPQEPQLARADAAIVFNHTLNGANCRSGCATEVLGYVGPNRWLLRIIVRRQPRCLQIDLDTFTYSEQRGLSGVQPSRCRL